MSLRFAHLAVTKMVFIPCSKGMVIRQNGFLFAHPVMTFLISVTQFKNGGPAEPYGRRLTKT